eukprot:1160941-Pelagomonas_calceolata.AAC.8
MSALLVMDVNFTFHEDVPLSQYTDFDELGPMKHKYTDFNELGPMKHEYTDFNELGPMKHEMHACGLNRAGGLKFTLRLRCAPSRPSRVKSLSLRNSVLFVLAWRFPGCQTDIVYYLVVTKSNVGNVL